MPPRILIAEDDELQGEVLRRALENRGYEAEIVVDGLEAVRRICTRHYDLALLDYQLPEVDGLAAAQLLHDLVLDQDRPRLIAITAVAPRLNEQQRLRGPSFDAIVSKQLGLPALLNVIDTNLAGVAKTNARKLVLNKERAIHATTTRRRCRWLALIAALPALTIVGVFMTAFGLEVAILRHAITAYGSAEQTIALRDNTGDLIKSMQNVESSQKAFLVDRTASSRDIFQANARLVDQMLVSSLPLSEAALPGFDIDSQIPAVIASRLRVLTDEANLPSSPDAAVILSETATSNIAQQLGSWAASVLSVTQEALVASVTAIYCNVRVVLVVLGAGIVLGLGSAVATIWQHLKRTNLVTILPPTTTPRLTRNTIYQ